MKKAWNSYKVFASGIYRIMVLLVIPLAFVGIMEVLIHLYGAPTIIWQSIIFAFALMYEMLNDYWTFGGICSREGCKMECMKLSLRGHKVMDAAVIFDLVRRWAYFMILALIYYVHSGSWQSFVIAQMAYIAMIIVLNISRYMTTFLMYLLINGVGTSIYYIFIYFVFSASFLNTEAPFEPGLFIGFGAIGVLLSVLMVIHIRYRWKESYYEKGSV